MRLSSGLSMEFEKFYVVFENDTSIFWLRCLKKGFRHCYVLLRFSGNNYLEINPMSNQIFVDIKSFPIGFDYLSYLEEQCQQRICEVEIAKSPLKPAPFGIFSCVEFAKRFLGIHNRYLITPYQLHKKIINCRKKILT